MIEMSLEHYNKMAERLTELEYLLAERQWIPCSERLPKRGEHRNGMVLVCYRNGFIRFNACINGEWIQGNPIAWMPLPEPMEVKHD